MTIGGRRFLKERVLAVPLTLLRQSVVGVAFVSLASRGHYSGRMSSSSSDQFAPSEEVSVADRKKTWRKQIRSELSRIPSETLHRESRMVWDRLFEMEEYKEARSIGVFVSMPKGEILTDDLLIDAARSNKVIYVPQVGENFEQSEMELIRIDTKVDPANQAPTAFHTSWPKNKWGIPEPPADMLRQVAALGDLDLLIVPGLAFDHRGNRLGQGKGYYDRFIAHMLSAPNVKRPYLVAVGLQCQLLGSDLDLPTNEHDQIMDMVLLPEQTITITER